MPHLKRKFGDFFVGDDWKVCVTFYGPNEEEVITDESSESENEDLDFDLAYTMAMCDMLAILDE